MTGTTNAPCRGAWMTTGTGLGAAFQYGRVCTGTGAVYPFVYPFATGGFIGLCAP